MNIYSYTIQIKKGECIKMKPEEAQEKLETISNELKELKDKKKELESMFTFKGLYSKLAGRENLLAELRDNKELSDEEKYNTGVKLIKEYAETL